MRRLVASALLITCAALTTGCGLLGEVTESTPELGSLETFRGKGFSIKLPCIPTRSEDRVPVAGGKPMTMRTWMCDGGDTAYSISTMKFPDDVQGNLDGVAQGSADGIDGEVVSSKKVTVAGAPGRDVRIRSTYDGEPAAVFQRVVVRGRILYLVQAMVLQGDTAAPPARYRRVLRSLTFS